MSSRLAEMGRREAEALDQIFLQIETLLSVLKGAIYPEFRCAERAFLLQEFEEIVAQRPALGKMMVLIRSLDQMLATVPALNEMADMIPALNEMVDMRPTLEMLATLTSIPVLDDLAPPCQCNDLSQP